MQRKTPNGEAFSLRDALRIAHPKADTAQRRILFGWIAGNVSDDVARDELPAVDRFLTAKAVTTPPKPCGSSPRRRCRGSSCLTRCCASPLCGRRWSTRLA
ncbi:hypothetical protein ACFQX6_10195 [Streptosporangium lutulentum]